MAKVYTVKYVVDGMVVYVDKAFLTPEDVATLQGEGVVVTAQ